MGVTKMNDKLKQLEKDIETAKKQIESLNMSAMEALKSKEYSFASRKVIEILEWEDSLGQLNESYENELADQENW